MRVRITRAGRGEVDGIPLATFQAGLTYDVPATLATYLITSGFADPVMDDAPALVVPVSEVRVAVSREPMAIAADTGVPADRKPVTITASRGSLH